MIYNGQLDMICGVSSEEAVLQVLDWYGLSEYLNANKFSWKVSPNDTEVAGYVRNVDNFYQVILQFQSVYDNLL